MIRTGEKWAALAILVAYLGHCAGQFNSGKGHCRHPLGIQDKRIPDSSMRATSYHSYSTSPKFARLGLDEGDGAWCMKGLLIPNNESEYIEVDLLHRSFVTVVATQGRYAKGHGKEFVRNYKLNYTRDGKKWFQWKNFRGDAILSGNSNSQERKNQLLNPPIQGVSGIRFIPITNRYITACMRVEIYGCDSLFDVVSYSTPLPGDWSKADNVFINQVYGFTDGGYDGTNDTGSLIGGLGQLTDGIIGSSKLDEMQSVGISRQIGYDYVGWKNNNNGDRFITITFDFGNVYNFSTMLIHTLTNPSLKADLFSAVQLSYQIDSQSPKYSVPVEYNVPPSKTHSNVISVPLGGNYAKSIKACFKICGTWLLISEVKFLTAEQANLDDDEMMGSGHSRIMDSGRLVAVVSPVDVQHPINKIPIIVGTLAAVILCLLLIVLLLAYRQRKLRKTMIPSRLIYKGSTRHNSTIHQQSVTVCIPEQTVTLTPTSFVNSMGKCKNEDAVYHEIHGNYSKENEYLEPRDVIKPVTLPRQNSKKLNSKVALFNTASTIPYYAETNLMGLPDDIQSIQGLTGSSLYAVPQNVISPTPAPRTKKMFHDVSETSTLLADDLDRQNFYQEPFLPIELPRAALTYIEKLGEGQFGEVQLCEADSTLNKLAKQQGIILEGCENSGIILAVKVLRKDAIQDAKEGFQKEIKILSQLCHPNIVRVIAVCTIDEPYLLAMEYMKHGDLHQYLQKFEMCTNRDESVVSNGVPEIRYHELLHIASQIASGMAYLSSLNLIHRDLAARNCLVGSNNKIQIADFGMSRNMYQSEYYRVQGKAVLPIRWMSWECVLMGKFSSASDVWAYGVTLWEIFTLCKRQPFREMDDRQVVENMHHMYQGNGEEVYLPKPKFCPSGVFTMIQKCWSKDPEDRPKFSQLRDFIQERIPAINNANFKLNSSVI